jgi:predicted dienelactone hydrolase
MSDAGKYKVIEEQVTVGDLVCGGSQDAYIWRPTESTGKELFPLISYAHGWGGGGDKIKYSGSMNSLVASAGYIVIATMSAPTKYCIEETLD